MIKIIYVVDKDCTDKEIEWLEEQHIYPAVERIIEIEKSRFVDKTRLGVIVNSDAALAIKLRHNLKLQLDYKQKS